MQSLSDGAADPRGAAGNDRRLHGWTSPDSLSDRPNTSHAYRPASAAVKRAVGDFAVIPLSRPT